MQNSLDPFHRQVKNGNIIEQIVVFIIIPVFLFYINFALLILVIITSYSIVIWAFGICSNSENFKKEKTESAVYRTTKLLSLDR